MRVPERPEKDFAAWGRAFFEYYRETDPTRVIGLAIKCVRHPPPMEPFELMWIPEALHRRRKDADKNSIDAQSDIARFALKYAWVQHRDGRRVTDDDRAAWFRVRRRAFLYQVKKVNEKLIACAHSIEREHEEFCRERGTANMKGQALVDFLVSTIKGKLAERQESAEWDKARDQQLRAQGRQGIDWSFWDAYPLPSVVEETVGYLCELPGVSRSAVYRALKKAWERGLIPEDAGYKPRRKFGAG